jgi:hypothetical protein
MKELKELVFSTRGAISVISRSPSPNPQGWGRVNPSLRARTMCARTTGRSGAAQRRRRCENRLCMPPSASARARGCRNAEDAEDDVGPDKGERRAPSLQWSARRQSRWSRRREPRETLPNLCRRARRGGSADCVQCAPDLRRWRGRLGDSGHPDARSPSLFVVPASAGSGRRCLPSRPMHTLVAPHVRCRAPRARPATGERRPARPDSEEDGLTTYV